MRVILNCALILGTAAIALAQPVAFEVASIKPSQQITPAMIQAGKIHVGIKIDAARVDIGNWTIMQMICEAYKLKPYQVTAPDWVKSLQAQRFDVIATMPAGSNKDQVPQMLQAMLTERFKLTIHNDKKDANVWALVVGKGGLKIKESTPPPPPADDDPSKPKTAETNTSTIKTTSNGATVSAGTGETQKMSMSPDGKSMRLDISNVTLSKLSEGLAPMLDLPLVDMTELKGRYDVVLDLSMQDVMNAARAAGANIPASPPSASASADASDPGGGSIFAAVQLLGLKLEKRKIPITGIVVDTVEKMPTEN